MSFRNAPPRPTHPCESGLHTASDDRAQITYNHGLEHYDLACTRARCALTYITEHAASILDVPNTLARELAPGLYPRVHSAVSTASKRGVVVAASTLTKHAILAPIVAVAHILDTLVRIAFAVRFGPRETGVTVTSIVIGIRRTLLPTPSMRRLILWSLISIYIINSQINGSARAPLDCDTLLKGSKECGVLHPDLLSVCVRTGENTHIGLRDWYIKARDQDKQVVYEKYADCKPLKTLRAKNIVVVSRTPTMKVHELSGVPAYCVQLLEERRTNGGRCSEEP